jgi:hypothetical protein
VEAGQDGLAHDGTVIPEEEMVDDLTQGADPDALRRFQESAELLRRFRAGENDSATLLAMLTGGATPRAAHRPAVMLRGDIHADELVKLRALYDKIRVLEGKRVRLSALAYGIFCLLRGIIEGAGEVVTDDCRSSTCLAYGFDAVTIATFDTALGIVWSTANKTPYSIVPGMADAVRALIIELGLDEEDLG